MTTFEKLVLRALSIIMLAVVNTRTVQHTQEWVDDAKAAALASALETK